MSRALMVFVDRFKGRDFTAICAHPLRNMPLPRRGRGRDRQKPQSVEPASVGIILDSSVIITAECRGHSVRQILEQGRVA
jgi:hypothetical protein